MFALRIKYKIQRVSAPHISTVCRKHSNIHHTRTDDPKLIRSLSSSDRRSSCMVRVVHWLRCRCVVQIPRRPFSLVCLSSKPNNNFDIGFFSCVLCVLVVVVCWCVFFFFLCSLLSVCSSREHRAKRDASERKARSGNIKQSRTRTARQWQKYRRYNII